MATAKAAPTNETPNSDGTGVVKDNTIKKSLAELLDQLKPKTVTSRLTPQEQQRLEIIAGAEEYFVQVGDAIISVASATDNEQALKKALQALKSVKDMTIKSIKDIPAEKILVPEQSTDPNNYEAPTQPEQYQPRATVPPIDDQPFGDTEPTSPAYPDFSGAASIQQ